jgi:hypothetical protein
LKGKEKVTVRIDAIMEKQREKGFWSKDNKCDKKRMIRIRGMVNDE